jgi:hypothetical protein
MDERQCIAFAGTRRVACGSIAEVAAAVRRTLDSSPEAVVLVFDAATSVPVEIDLRGSVEDVLSRLSAEEEPAAPEPRRSPGRPRLGVVGREVTLLPRHWEWLNAQPGGASVTLRRLVEEARLSGGAEERRREARESAYRFMFAMAGNEPGFEDATRALFAGDRDAFEALSASWPADVGSHARCLAEPAW